MKEDMDEKDFVDEFIEATEDRVPGFSEMVEAADRLRQLIEDMAAIRRELGMSQKSVAALMGTSQSAIARLETTEYSPNLSTLQRYAWALGQRVEFSVAPIPIDAADADAQRTQAQAT